MTVDPEVLRRLDELSADLRGLRADLDRTYVRQDVYRSDQRLALQERRETAANVLAIATEAKRKASDVEDRVSTGEEDREKATKERANLRRMMGVSLFCAISGPIVTALIARAVT